MSPYNTIQTIMTSNNKIFIINITAISVLIIINNEYWFSFLNNNKNNNNNNGVPKITRGMTRFCATRFLLAILKHDNVSHRGEKLSCDISMTELSLWQKLLQCVHYIFYCIF